MTDYEQQAKIASDLAGKEIEKAWVDTQEVTIRFTDGTILNCEVSYDYYNEFDPESKYSVIDTILK